jgi:hypothetical protein
MTTRPRFQCPACGFAVFNRRVASCESCSAELPIEFRFSPSEISRIDEDHARNDKTRAEMAREAAELERVRQRRANGDGRADLLGGLLDGFDGGD